MNTSLYAFFRQHFESESEQAFLTDPNGDSHTYGDIDARSSQFAEALETAGCRIGDRVVVQVEKSPDAVALYFACLRAGFVYVPLNTAYTTAEVQYFLDDTGAATFVCDPNRHDEFASLIKNGFDKNTEITLLTLGTQGIGTLPDQAGACGLSHQIVQRSDTDLAAMLYTSGTTGRSKGAMLTHRGLRQNALALHQIWHFEPGDVLLHALPIFHVHGLFVALHCAIINRSEVIFCQHFDPNLVVEQLPKASVLMGVPTHYTRLLTTPGFDAEVCSHIRLFTSGSAPMTEQVFDTFYRQTGKRICERYGMTECGIITSNPYEGLRTAGTVGFALPGFEMRVVTDNGIAAADETGMVEVKGDHLFAGYWNLPQKTAEEMTSDGFFKTGDIGSLDAGGRLTLAGRSGDMIISGGLNIYPKEIESVLDDIKGVEESAVIGLPHSDFGEAVAAYVVPSATTDLPGLEAALRSACTANLARFKHPKHYTFLDELPRNTMGKVQKAGLRRDNAELFSADL